MAYHVNRQIGDYVIYSKEENTAPFFIRMAGDDTPLSTCWSVTEAAQAITALYKQQQARKRKSR